VDIDQRIAQFENMCREDPDNDMAHFSLGSAYSQAERYPQAAESFTRCIQINPAMSKAYQLAGAAYMAAGQTELAADILTRGYRVAAERGDLMPRDGIAELLTQLGAPIPEVKTKQRDVPEGSFICQRTGRPGTKMDRPPFRGPVGEWIAQNISQETFQAWIEQGTKVINELRLDLSRDEDAAMYDQHMHEFLRIDAEMLERLRQSHR
jgi:Fe-S cluster biosynthesis and repair protein YggX